MPTPRKLDTVRALKLRASGMSYRQIASLTNSDKSTVHQTLAPILAELADPKTTEMYRSKQAEIMDGLAAKTVASITDEDISKSGFRDRVVALGILTDKSRLIRGESTSNNLVIHANAAIKSAEDWGKGHVVDASPCND